MLIEKFAYGSIVFFYASIVNSHYTLLKLQDKKQYKTKFCREISENLVLIAFAQNRW